MGSHQVLHHQKLLEWHRRIFQTAGYVESCLYIVETEANTPCLLFIASCLFIYYLIAICRKVERNRSNIASLELSVSAQCT